MDAGTGEGNGTPEQPATIAQPDVATFTGGAERAATAEVSEDVPEPVHVSEEATLVREEAEPGAEDGAGAEVSVREPWDGYAHMNAREVIARLSDETLSVLAAVQLYESAHRSRQTVLEAVEREQKAAQARSSRE
jgi:hypothetical protein